MSATSRTAVADAPDASEVAAALRDAPFVRFVARADGDALAASGVLARALADADVPFQVRVARLGAARADPGDDTVVVSVGHPDVVGDVSIPAGRGGPPASVTAFDAARELGGTPDPVLALAGAFSAGRTPGAGDTAHLLEGAASAGVERRSGVSVPTADLADGVAHTTLAHADFSGETGAAQAALAELALPAELDDDARRTVASELAFAVTASEAATARAAEAVERALGPFAVPDGPFATVGGYADVLDAVAREQPGTGVALALGYDVRTEALAAWRDHAADAHTTLREATTGRYDGLFVARVADAPVETVARLLRDFRSPEPVALVVGDAEAAAASVADAAIGETMTRAAARVDGVGGGTARRGYAQFDADTKEFLTAFREEL